MPSVSDDDSSGAEVARGEAERAAGALGLVVSGEHRAVAVGPGRGRHHEQRPVGVVKQAGRRRAEHDPVDGTFAAGPADDHVHLEFVRER